MDRWRASATPQRVRNGDTARFMASRELIRGDRSIEPDVPDVDQLAADVVAILGAPDAVRWVKRCYGAVMRAAGTDAA